MSDWQVGDLALCVNADPCPVYPGSEGGITLNAIYVVKRVQLLSDVYGQERLGLVLDRHNPVHPITRNVGAHNAARFRKIRPDTHEACEEEFVKLLRRSKRRVSA